MVNNVGVEREVTSDLLITWERFTVIGLTDAKPTIASLVVSDSEEA